MLSGALHGSAALPRCVHAVYPRADRTYYFLLSGCVQFYQCLSHMVIAVNRFTVLAWTTRHEMIWTRKFVVFVAILLLVVPCSLSSPRLALNVTVVPSEEGYQYVTTNKCFNTVRQELLENRAKAVRMGETHDIRYNECEIFSYWLRTDILKAG